MGRLFSGQAINLCNKGETCWVSFNGQQFKAIAQTPITHSNVTVLITDSGAVLAHDIEAAVVSQRTERFTQSKPRVTATVTEETVVHVLLFVKRTDRLEVWTVSATGSTTKHGEFLKRPQIPRFYLTEHLGRTVDFTFESDSTISFNASFGPNPTGAVTAPGFDLSAYSSATYSTRDDLGVQASFTEIQDNWLVDGSPGSGPQYLDSRVVKQGSQSAVQISDAGQAGGITSNYAVTCDESGIVLDFDSATAVSGLLSSKGVPIPSVFTFLELLHGDILYQIPFESEDTGYDPVNEITVSGPFSSPGLTTPPPTEPQPLGVWRDYLATFNSSTAPTNPCWEEYALSKFANVDNDKLFLVELKDSGGATASLNDLLTSSLQAEVTTYSISGQTGSTCNLSEPRTVETVPFARIDPSAFDAVLADLDIEAIAASIGSQ